MPVSIRNSSAPESRLPIKTIDTLADAMRYLFSLAQQDAPLRQAMAERRNGGRPGWQR
jgi:hypothetical protein